MSSTKKTFPLVAIGASAGGLDAAKELLRYLSPGTGMAYFYIQHLSPEHASSLASILSRDAKIKVQEATNMMQIEPDNVYVCTPNTEMALSGGKIKLIPREDKVPPYLPIDNFFYLLAKRHRGDIIGVVLSGNANDGTKGLKAIKERGGLTFAQDSSAKYKSMPTSAINAGVVDQVLSPKEIARELVQRSKTGDLKTSSRPYDENTIDDNDPYLRMILNFLHEKAGVDFGHYKMATIKRRMLRRMFLCNLETLKDYAKLLNENVEEIELLSKDLLINVTSFFREKDVFRSLKAVHLPKLFRSKKTGEPLRIWIPACSTGEEVYSFAMILHELRATGFGKTPVQIFATDLSEDVINTARTALYSEHDIKEVTRERVKKFFTKEGDNYRVIKELRQMCIFAVHNLLSDPPLSRMDMVSCCNLLIYLDAAAQNRVIPTLHFALNEGGYLMLGKSETISGSLLFTPADQKHKIFLRRKETVPKPIPQLVRNAGILFSPRQKKHAYIFKSKQPPKKLIKTPLNEVVDAILLSEYVPACAVINKEMEILQFRGSTSLYMAHAPGKASLNIFKMTRPECTLALRTAINEAIKSKSRVTKQDIEIKLNDTWRAVSISVHPLDFESDEPLLLIVFTLGDSAVSSMALLPSKNSLTKANENRIKKLTNELSSARSEMHTIIESLETTYEDLQVANEEIVSSNEELQTLNEELETSKEEVEASNEELVSTNQELRMRNDMLVESDNYTKAILDTIHEPMVILNNEMLVKSTNRVFRETFNASNESINDKYLFDIGGGQWNIPELHQLLEDNLAKSANFNNLKVSHNFPDLGEKVMLFNASRIEQKSYGDRRILLAIQDITELAQKEQIEKEMLYTDIRKGKMQNEYLEKAVEIRTKEIEDARKILESTNIELEALNKDLTSFTYISSYDLQEPLRKIQVFTDVLLKEEESNLSDKGKQYFNRLSDTARHMQMLLEDLLTYSRTKVADRVFEKVHLSTIIDSVKTDLHEKIEAKKAVITTRHLREVNVIPSQFLLLINNLVSNSIKFSYPQRPLRIMISSKIEARTNAKHELINFCRITVKDNGIGFDNQYNERIFEVFERLHANDEYEGTGIGLAICKRIVENHNGMITASGKVDKGAHFDVYIPM